MHTYHHNLTRCCTKIRFGWFSFLGAACGSPYIVFISTSGMLCLSDIYIYIIRVPTRNSNNEFILERGTNHYSN